MENILYIAAAFFLVLLNGFFVAAEFGLVKLRQTRLQSIAEAHGMRGRILVTVHRELDSYLSACQLGITLASLGLGWIGEPAFARLLEPVFAQLGLQSAELVHGVAFFLAFFIISFLHIVVGELAPKSMAIRDPENVGLWTALPLYGFYWMMYPAIWVLNTSSSAVLRLAGLDGRGGHDTHYSADEIKVIMRTTRPSQQFNRDEWNVLAHSLEFGEFSVSDLMRPINEVVALYRGDSHAENMQTILRNRYSRYPYFDHDRMKVLGLIHTKDLFIAQQEGRSIDDLGAYLRPVQLIAPSMAATELFRRFRTGAPHFAIVGRKQAMPYGFITLDNLLGALVGEIRDEFRKTDNDWTRMDDGTLLGKGSLSIVSLERALGIDIDEDEEVESVGGLVMNRLGDLPQEGQKISFDGFSVVVKRMNGPRILLVRVYPEAATDDIP